MKRHGLSYLVTLLLLALLSGMPGSSIAADTNDLDERLVDLVERMELRRTELHVPGLALVVVKDGAVVLAQGFGVVDLETREPVTAETLFMIGSTTKAFTSTLVSMMVDEGKMNWDAPIATYLPYFDPDVDSDDSEARVTLRDTLSHRSGFSRMGMLLTAQDVEPAEILQVAAGAQPFDGFRQTFHYNNIMFLAAGTASAEVSNTDWHHLIRKRIFKPLGMKHSSTISGKTRGELHPGYSWIADLEEHDRQPILPIDGAAPAGSVVSNASDMGKWLQFMTSGGMVRGKRLVDETALKETWTSNIAIAEDFDYGMGWFVRKWEGHRMLEHGGNIHGFGAQVGFLPDDGIGFALMTNLTATPLQQESLAIVFDSLLGEDAPPEDTTIAGASAEELSPYLGDFVADFGPFKDATFEVTEKDGVLFVDVPGQTNYEIRPPGDDGRRSFAITDTVAVSFESKGDHGFDMMRMHQGGLSFELPRRGVEFEAEIDPLELAPYLGSYHSPTFNADVPVRMKNQHLAIDIPGEMAYELRLPDENGYRRFRVRDVVSVSFDLDEEGRVSTLILRKDDKVIDTMTRSGDPDGKPLPTMSELLAIRASDDRRAAESAAGIVKAKSRVNMIHAGLNGMSVAWGTGQRFRSELDFGAFGWVHVTLNPDLGQTQTHVTPIDEIKGRQLHAMLEMQCVVQVLDWQGCFETLQVLRWEQYGDRSALLVQLRNGDASPIRALVDPETGDLLRFEASVPVPGAGTEIPVSVTLEDYRDVEGLRIPFRTTTENPESGQTITVLESLETGIEAREGLYTLDQR